MNNIRQTKNYAAYLTQIGWKVERIKNTNYFLKKIPIVGYILKVQRPKKIDFTQITTLTKKYKLFQVIIEPELTPSLRSMTFFPHTQLLAHGYKLSKSPYLPSKTIFLDLKKPWTKLLKDMKKDARLAIKNYDEDKNPIVSIKDVNAFYYAWKKTVGLKRYVTPLKHLLTLRKSFKKNCIFLVAQNTKGEIISGAVFLKTKNCVYYWQAFTNKEGREKNAQYSIIANAIRWGVKNNCRSLDFEGIYDKRFPNKSWLGFSHFKKSFGGKETEFPGCYIKTKLLGYKN